MLKFLYTCLLLILYVSCSCQLSGTVIDESGIPLSYVNIYVRATSVGTTTNVEGEYLLKLQPGEYNLVFQYIGYRTESEIVTIVSGDERLDIQLSPESYTLNTITLSANAEDPAYAIIRKAQAQRKYYQNRVSAWSCNAYVRGFNQLLDAPEKIMGIDVGDMDGLLDSSRQGVIYLSESVSKLYYREGEQKEVMYSSRISGDDKGYSFNSAREMTFDFYGNYIELNKRIITPIAGNAFSYYDYKLEGATIDDHGQLVNKIRVIPKNAYAPCFYGFIYINDGLWNINSLELGVTSKSSQLAFIDSLTFSTSYIPLDADIWMPFSNIINFKLKALGFILKGNFAAVYSNYELDSIPEGVFNNEIFVVQKEANTRTWEYWDSLRPIPLTTDERIDYVRKDSIREVKNSAEYRDSVDRSVNKFEIMDIVGGYGYQNSGSRTKFEIISPFQTISLNTVQGWHITTGLSFDKDFDDNSISTFNAAFRVNYGFSEEKWRPDFSLSYRTNRINNLNFELSGGKKAVQLNPNEPISGTLNTFLTLFARRNYMKLYDKEFLQLKIHRDLGDILRLNISSAYEFRSPLENHFSESLFFENKREFTPNIPVFESHKALLIRASLRVKPGEKVWRYPDRKFRAGSAWPTLWLHYKKAIGLNGLSPAYDLIRASIFDRFSLSIYGESSLYLHGGIFPGENPEYLIDHFHFNGNQTHIGYPPEYATHFLLLPYYTHSTADKFVQFHFLHNFQGWLLNRIPVFKKLGWQLSAGYKYLDTTEHSAYDEIHLGIDNIGFNIFRMFRVDFVWQGFLTDEPTQDTGNFGIVLGLKAEL